MKTKLVKLRGKSGYACKIYMRGRHVATVAHPDRPGEAGARQAAFEWERDWKDKLFPKEAKWIR